VAGSRRVEDQLREARLAKVRQGICETIAPFDLRVDADQDCIWTPDSSMGTAGPTSTCALTTSCAALPSKPPSTWSTRER